MNKALNFSQFNKINESSFIPKKDVGIIGPNLKGDVKLKISNPGLTLKKIDSGENFVFEVGDKSCSVPKKFINVSQKPGYDVVSFNTNSNWFKVGENSDAFMDILEDYVSSEYELREKKISSTEEDVNIILDMLGIENDVEDFDQKSPLKMEGTLSNGMEFEIQKNNEFDFFQKFFLYRNQDSIHPLISIKRGGGKYNFVYRTPKGIFKSNHDSMGEMINNPVDKYLISCCFVEKDEESQGKLVDHLMKLFRYHTWANTQNKEKATKSADEMKEIKRIMDMLKNTISETHIEQMYSDARSKFFKK